jgi:hypothetical protein
VAKGGFWAVFKSKKLSDGMTVACKVLT